jgi:hypothetical protein
VVFSPAEMHTAYHGRDISNASGDETQAVRDHGFCIRRAMKSDLNWIIDHAVPCTFCQEAPIQKDAEPNVPWLNV